MTKMAFSESLGDHHQMAYRKTPSEPFYCLHNRVKYVTLWYNSTPWHKLEAHVSGEGYSQRFFPAANPKGEWPRLGPWVPG